MKPGPKKIIACPQCRALHKYGTLISGNTIGGSLWTDGYAVFPMMPSIPEVTKCGKCNSIFWLREFVPVGEYGGCKPILEMLIAREQPPEVVPQDWSDAPVVEHLGGDDCLRALESNLYRSRIEEVTLCLTAWHARNHRVREELTSRERAALYKAPVKSKAKPRNVITSSQQAIKILDRLLTLLDEKTPRERLLKAEALRELGRFEETLAVLEGPFPGELREAVSFIRTLAEQEIFHVAKLPVKERRAPNL